MANNDEGKNSDLIYRDESYAIIGVCMEIHRTLGKGFSEAVYKDAMQHEFFLRKMKFEREKQYKIEYKGIILPHAYCADFVYDEKIILEIKAQQMVLDDHYKQTLNYIAAAKIRLGLLINFGENSLTSRREVL